MVAVHDQFVHTPESSEVVDHREAVRVRCWRFVGDQNVEPLSREALEVIGKDRVAVPRAEVRRATVPSGQQFVAAKELLAWLR